MLNNLLGDVDRIYLAYGATDFRKQTSSLCSIVQNSFKMNPYDRSAYIFCNSKRNSIRVLCYDKNGFILAKKTVIFHIVWVSFNNFIINNNDYLVFL